MSSRQRVVMAISVPPDTAKECKKIAKEKGESVSQLFRDMFLLYKHEKLKDEFYQLQRYGSRKAKELKINEKSIEKIILEGR